MPEKVFSKVPLGDFRDVVRERFRGSCARLRTCRSPSLPCSIGVTRTGKGLKPLVSDVAELVITRFPRCHVISKPIPIIVLDGNHRTTKRNTRG